MVQGMGLWGAGDGATLSDPATEKPNAGATASSPSQGARGFVKTKPPLKIYYCTHSGVLKRGVHSLSYRYPAPLGPMLGFGGYNTRVSESGHPTGLGNFPVINQGESERTEKIAAWVTG